MNILAKFRPETQAAMSHMLLRGLCMLIIEYDCARLIQEATGQQMIRVILFKPHCIFWDFW